LETWSCVGPKQSPACPKVTIALRSPHTHMSFAAGLRQCPCASALATKPNPGLLAMAERSRPPPWALFEQLGVELQLSIVELLSKAGRRKLRLACSSRAGQQPRGARRAAGRAADRPPAPPARALPAAGGAGAGGRPRGCPHESQWRTSPWPSWRAWPC
jgi:hypothetical protein